ncbi:MAG TPA: hypothetical protein VFA21_22355 [Pyrinomonadaceae bacterium]|nr:hypothetical protein [Pyrinomonadaceae bacterium]
MSSINDKDKLDDEYTYRIAAISQIFVKANCPDKFHKYIFCLVAVADQDYVFQASDATVATHARGKIEGGGTHADKGWARDKRRELSDWQNDGNLELVGIEVQDPDTKTHKRPPTKYTMHILKYAEQVVAAAKQSDLNWQLSSSAAIERAADELVADLLGRRVNVQQKKYLHPPSEVVAMIKNARTNLKKAAEMLKKHNFQMMRDDEDLLDELERYIKEVRDRGFIDDLLDTPIFTGIERPNPKP